MEKEVEIVTEFEKLDKEEEILQRINDTVSLAYESALNSGLQTVKAALSKSTFDGDKAKHSDTLNKLKAFAKKIWTNKIVKDIKQ